MEMNKEEAIKYLERKDRIKGKKIFSKEEEAKIKEVMKKGKIYGDPVCEVY